MRPARATGAVLGSDPLDSAQGTCLLSFSFQWFDAVELISAILISIICSKRKARSMEEGHLAQKNNWLGKEYGFLHNQGLAAWRMTCRMPRQAELKEDRKETG